MRIEEIKGEGKEDGNTCIWGWSKSNFNILTHTNPVTMLILNNLKEYDEVIQ